MTRERSWYVLRDDKPDPECNCGGPLVGNDHPRWCATNRDRGGTFYYVGQDLEGHWWMPGIEQAMRLRYRVAQRLRRELPGQRKPTIEKVEA